MPRDPGGGGYSGRRTRGSTKPKRPPKPKPPRQDPFAGLPGHVDPTTGKVTQPQDVVVPTRPQQQRDARRRREILRRQRLLRGSGVNIVVDGIWGPRSQKAWNDYLRNRSVVVKRSPADKIDLSDPKAAPAAKVDRREQQRLQRQEQQRRIEAEAKRRLREQKQLVVERAGTLRRDPTAARAMTLRDLADVLVDKDVDYDPARNPQLTRALQEHLKAQGFKVAVTGQFDEATNAALKKAFKKAAEQERAEQIGVIRERLFKSGLVKPGDTPDWWSFGKIPETGELLETIQRGGFDGDLMFKQLLLQALDPSTGWNLARNRQLLEIASTVAPIGNNVLAQVSGNPAAIPAWMYLVDILSVSDLMPFGDYSKMTEEERKRALKWRSESEEVKFRNAEAVGNLRQAAKTLVQAEGPEEFQRKMGILAAASDKRIKEFQQKSARKSSFWGDAISAVLLPGEWTRQAIVASVANSADVLTGDFDPDDVIRQEGAEKILADMNPVLRFGFELTVDPLNLVAPTRVVSAATYGVTRTAARGAARVGVSRLETAGSSLGRYVLTGEGLSRAIVYQKGTWDKAAVIKSLVATDDVLKIQESRLGEKVAEFQRRMAQTKDEAFSAVNDRLRQASTLGWKQPTFKVAGQTIKLPKIGDREAQKLLDETDVLATNAVANAPWLKAFVHEMKQRGGSLWIHANRQGELSQYGASLRGHWAETYRALTAARLAVETANGVYRKVMFDKFGAAWESLADDAARKEAGQAAISRYMEVMNGFGTYVAAGADPVLREAELFTYDKVTQTLASEIRDLPKLLDERVNKLLEETEKVVFPSLQDELERHADSILKRSQKLAAEAADGTAAEHSIWDTDGLWRHRAAAQDGDLVDVIRRSFGRDEIVRIKNPRYGYGHTAAEMTKAFRSELRRRVGRLESYAARRIQTGTIKQTPEGLADAAARFEEEKAAIIREVREAWQPGPDGMFYDARKTVEASNLYLRHLARFSKRRLDFSGDDEVDFLAVLGDTPGMGDKLTGIEKGLFDFASAMAQYGRVPLAGTKGFVTPGVGKDGRAMADNLREAVDRRMNALHRAEAGSLSSLLREQGAFWLAWQHANSLPMKIAYKALNGQLQLWKFATLALRPAWAVRNFIDNTVKAIIKGVRDPRYFLVGPGAKLGSVLAQDIGQLRQLIRFLDGLFGTDALTHFDRIADKVWELPSHVLSKVFWMHNIEVPPEVFDSGLKRDIFSSADDGLRLTRQPADERLIELGLKEEPSRFAKGRVRVSKQREQLGEFFWNILGNGPENYARAVIYRKAYADGLKEIQKKGLFRNELNGDQVARIVVDEGAARVALEKMVGAELAGKVELEFTRISRDDMKIAGWWWPGHDGGGLIEMFIPDDVLVRSVEEANSYVRALSETLAHEARHAEQRLLAGRTPIARADSALPYGIQLKEIDARVFERVRAEAGLKAFRVDNVLPSELNTAEIHIAATNRAIKAVEDTLFDYSKISVAEENLKVFFPFIQYWRKNSIFWAQSFGEKPWLTNAVLQFDDERRDAQGDLPSWMARYFHTDDIADALAVVPGLPEAFDALGLGDGAQFDPINMLSLAPFYRAFKQGVYGENVNLPSDRPGVKIIAPIIDSLNEWGLGVNPLFRKPLEATGIANYRAWQRIFPQTSLIEALANASGHEGIGKLAVAMERISSFGFPVTDSNAIAENFDYWVQTVVAEQVARGEEPDVADAEETVRHWFLVQNLWGYFGGIYWRRATPEDMYLSKLQDDVLNGHIDYDALSSQDKKLLRLWSMRGMDRLVYDRYIDLLPVIEAYYRADLETKDEIVKANPEIIRWVDGDYTGNPVSQKFIRYAHRYVDQEQFFEATEIADSLDVADSARKMAQDMFISPELRDFWRLNDTPSRIRDRMVQAEVRSYFDELNKSYFAIPESDFEARDAFVQDHPELIRSWNRNNDPADDYEAISGHVKADLRDSYFRIVKARGFEGAAEFLKQYPFMFEGTKSESKIKDGEWIPGDSSKWSAERLHDFRLAKPNLNWFFDTFMPKVGEEKAWAWLQSAEGDRAESIRTYLNKYPSAKRLDYMRAAPWLKRYFGMPPADRAAWLRGDSEGAKIVRAYFEKYANEKGNTQHAKDYLDTKGELKYYFSLPEDSRSDWLRSDDPRAVKVLAYFKKYGKEHSFERGFNKLVAEYPELRDGTPEQVRRLDFWRRYYALTPDKRPAFVAEEAEAAGIFIYGEFGEKEMHDREQGYLRRAVGLGLSKRQSAFLYVKPLLDFYRTLTKDEKQLFVKANPELQWYFDNFSTKSPTGDKQLDKLVEQYFSLPGDSLARSKFLREHPAVQDYFDKHSSPAEAAMRSLLEQYFALGGWARASFLDEHPEIATYFERRRDEKREEQDALRAFDFADPRLEPFFRDAADLERAAVRMRERLRRASINSLIPDGIGVRRERRAA